MLKYYISIEVFLYEVDPLKGKKSVEGNLFTELKLSCFGT